MLGPGTVIDARYRLERVLGRGGMGVVIEARHVQLGTPVALKFLHRSVAGSPQVIERFFREARATAAMTSEHVCRVFDFGMFEGAPYLVMERLEGADLAQLLRRRTRLPVAEACDYVIQACAGLAEAHAAKIVHRDLKPGNLFLTSRADGTSLIKVLDFGIAKAPQDGDEDLTGTNAVLGSPLYMSLEQLRSSKLVDTRSDLWSLGIILFEMVSGRRPYVADGIADLALKIVMEPIPRLGDGPSPLDDVIAGCLAREPAQRFPNVAALAGALAPFAGELAASSPLIVGADLPARAPSGRRSAVHALGPHDPAIFEPGTTVQSSGAIEAGLPARTTRSRLGVLGMLVAAAAVGTSLAVAVTHEDRASAPPAAQPRPAPAESAAPARVAPAGSAAGSTAPPAPRGASPPPVRAAEATPPGSADAGVVEPVAAPAAASPAAASPAAAPDAGTPIAAPRPVEAPPRRAPARPKPHAPKPSTAELSKSRI